MSAKWKLVPVEPTREMLAAAGEYENFCAVHNYGGPPDAEGAWGAMLSAAPQHSGGDERDIVILEGLVCQLEREAKGERFEAGAHLKREQAKSLRSILKLLEEPRAALKEREDGSVVPASEGDQ